MVYTRGYASLVSYRSSTRTYLSDWPLSLSHDPIGKYSKVSSAVIYCGKYPQIRPIDLNGNTNAPGTASTFVVQRRFIQNAWDAITTTSIYAIGSPAFHVIGLRAFLRTWPQIPLHRVLLMMVQVDVPAQQSMYVFADIACQPEQWQSPPVLQGAMTAECPSES